MDSDRLLRDLLREAGDAIILADSDGTIRFWNRGATDIFGYERKEAEGRSLDIIIPDGLQERHWEAYYEAMETGEFSYGRGDLLSVPATRQDDERRSVEFTVTPLTGDSDNAVVAIAAIVRDITQQYERRQEREARIEELEETIETLREDGESSDGTDSRS